VAPGLLGGFDELPAFIERDSSWDLGGRVFSGLHGRDADWDMPFPRCGGEDEVEVATLAQPQKIPIAAKIAFGLRLARLNHPLLDAADFFFDEVADSLDFNSLDLEEVLDMVRAHVANADKPDADRIDRRHLELEERFIARVRPD
jgi:hypothetical protein